MRAIEPRSRGLVFVRPAVYGWFAPPLRDFSARFNGLMFFPRMSYGALMLTHYPRARCSAPGGASKR